MVISFLTSVTFQIIELNSPFAASFSNLACTCLFFPCVCNRDFAAANMIGANGLKGKSWLDLDMLPLGWLTVAGKASKKFSED